MSTELYKLATRRIVAIPLVAVATTASLFLIVYGSFTKQTELVTLGAGPIFMELGALTAYYFSKKLEEE